MVDKVKMHSEICCALNELYRCKNKDYGDSFGISFHEEGLAMPRIRLGDKLNRFNTLTRSHSIPVEKSVNLALNHVVHGEMDAAINELSDLSEELAWNKPSVTNESLEDTLMDMANYAIMTIIELRLAKGETAHESE